MIERSIFLYFISLVGLALSFSYGGVAAPGADPTLGIIAVLAAIVLASVSLLFSMLKKYAAACVVMICALTITVWAAWPAFLPMAVAVALTVLSAAKLNNTVTGMIAAIVYLVCALVFRPEMIVIVATALLLGLSVYVLILLERHRKTIETIENNDSRVEDMQARLSSQRRMVRSTEHVSRLEERNRLAARIHDEIGHGMSGSILLLEGAELVMDKEPEKARETIKKVAENLRASVEKIREVLREERSVGAEVSLARIEKELDAFETDHPQVKIRLDTKGDMGSVNNAVWICVYENMIEALTNVLKHSPATLFIVTIKNIGALVSVEFADNGGTDDRQGAIVPGIGLQSMEERTALCSGRCFFRHEPDGFHVVMTFPRREG